MSCDSMFGVGTNTHAVITDRPVNTHSSSSLSKTVLCYYPLGSGPVKKEETN